MDKKLSRVFWGIVLILSGAIALAQGQGYLNDLPNVVWAVAFGIIAIAALVVYLVGEKKNWPILFPFGIFGALAVMLALEDTLSDNAWIAGLLFVGIGLPFVVAYFLDRAKHWWAIIPAGIMLFLAITISILDNFRDEWVGTALFLILALVFFLVYLSHKKTWAILVAYIMLVLSPLPVLDLTAYSEISGAVLFFGIGAPFLYLYFKTPERWWAIIPAGILLTLGITTAVMILFGERQPDINSNYGNLILMAGFAATFAVLGLRNQKRWGIILAIIFAVVGVSSLFVNNSNVVAPLAMIAIGIFVVFNAIQPRGGGKNQTD